MVQSRTVVPLLTLGMFLMLMMGMLVFTGSALPRPRPLFAGAKVHSQADDAAADTQTVATELLAFRDRLTHTKVCPYVGMSDGSLWPMQAEAISMAGFRRLDNFAALVALAIHDNIPGHVIETGCWRGGASFLATKTIQLLKANRDVYLCDSFEGIPEQRGDLGKEVTAQDQSASQLKILLENSLESVRNSAIKLGLPLDRMHFVKGFFEHSLSKLCLDQPELRFSVLRLDGDTYESTMDAISKLYSRLSPGGFVIVDDFTDWPGCHKAILDYRAKHGITDPIIAVPHPPGEVVRGVYWRKDAQATHALCARNPMMGTSGGHHHKKIQRMSRVGLYHGDHPFFKPEVPIHQCEDTIFSFTNALVDITDEDVRCYKQVYPDVKSFNKTEIIIHWQENGLTDGRVYPACRALRLQSALDGWGNSTPTQGGLVACNTSKI